MKLSKRVERNLRKLRKLQMLKDPGKREKAIKEADKELISCLIEITANLLKNKVPLKPSQKKRLAAYADDLRELAQCRSVAPAKEVLVQSGSGFLPLLIAPIVSMATELVSSLIRK